jgi:hypothetical protein
VDEGRRRERPVWGNVFSIRHGIQLTGSAMKMYDPLKPPKPEEWQSMDEQERLDLVEGFHRRAGIRVPNAKVHAVIHVIVENQFALGDELPVKRTVQRLMSEGLDRHDAIHAVGSVLIGHISDLLAALEAEVGADPNPPYYRPRSTDSQGLVIVWLTRLRSTVGACVNLEAFGANSEFRNGAPELPLTSQPNPQNENARGERAFSVVLANLGVVGSSSTHAAFGGLVKNRVNSQNH